MRDYIILNGINSQEITGLLIQTLPPISQPKIRTNIEEIDGRDGDIITKLGYSAYDKEFTIGLYGDYDVNEVIAYFTNNQSGKVTFSNEEDKYYYYEILEQIDFEKLIRYKTATVKMHMQPFKYSNVEEFKSFTLTNESEIYITNNGNYVSKPIITLTGSGTLNIYLNNYRIFIITLTEIGDDPVGITLDIENMNAYVPDYPQFLMNRSVTGDYDKFRLISGKNRISWTGGTITDIQIKNYSRWI